MTKLVLEDVVVPTFSGLTGSVELCDKSGKTLGVFYPAFVQDPAIYDGLVSPISDEELERRSKEEGGSSLPEIWKRLGVK